MGRSSGHSVYEFEGFRLDGAHAMLYRHGREIPLPRKAIETLAALVERAGEIIGKDELMEAVWPDTVVEESNLSQYLHQLRKTLGVTGDKRPFIETLRRRGVRFNAAVTVADGIPAASTTHFLPSSLIGRETEVAQVLDLLGRDDVRLVTLTGVGGVGKTTLARTIAAALDTEFEDGVFFVELAPITNSELVVPSIASSVGIRETGEISVAQMLLDRLRDQRVLLILDNFEQVVSAAPDIARLVKGAPAIKILVTSRTSLHITAEKEYLVPPLQLPAVDHGVVEGPLTELAGYESIRLFVERAQTARSSFTLTDENVACVAEICSRLDGLPLAIELAAARIRVLSPADILSRLENRLRLLTGGASDLPERQRTMRATIAWSIDLLDESEKQLFSRLSIFAGGFTLEAAEKICDRPTTDLGVLDGLTALVDHHLLMTDDGAHRARFRMLEVVREYAFELLRDRDETADVQRLHAEYFAELGEEAEPHLQAARSSEWLDRLEVEHDNLRCALEWAKDADPGSGQRLAGAVWRFWWLHGHIREGCEQLALFLSLSADADTAVRAKMLAGASFMNRLRGRSDLSREYTEQALVLAQNSDDKKNAALSLLQLGFLTVDEGGYEEARQLFEEGLELAKELGDKQVLGLLYNGMGESSRLLEDYDRASEFYGEALRFNREAGDRVRQTTNLINLGATALSQGDMEGAGSFYSEALAIASEMADMNGTLYCLEGVAGSYWISRDPKRSARLFGAAAATRSSTNLFVEAADRALYDLSRERVRKALPDGSFDVLVSEGRRMKLDDAVALALHTVKR